MRRDAFALFPAPINVPGMKVRMLMKRLRQEAPFHIMMLPAIVQVLLFAYLPMAGIIIAFQRFIPAKGLFGNQQWVGLDNFIFVLTLPDAMNVIANTVTIALFKMIGMIIVPVTVSLILNEVASKRFKKWVQTTISFPHFLSWIILGGIMVDILSPSYGIVNQFLGWFGLEPVFFLGDKDWFQFTMITTDIWKEFGFGTIIYLATIVNIDQQIFESAKVDGANRWQLMWHITLPGMRSIIALMALLSLGNILNAGFDQIFNLQNSLVMDKGDIIDTFVYRLGLINFKYGIATAMGLFKSIISFLFIGVAYFLAYKFTDYKIF